ncbi:MAG: hypothetical protein QF464_19955, partial [Myxococcota bacterium]|nr:hypothetical protein [Myxococcota bacterium]
MNQHHTENRKLLRVGIVQSGQLVDEHLIREGEDVTIGQSARDTIIVPSSHPTRSFTLYSTTGDGYQLLLDDT